MGFDFYKKPSFRYASAGFAVAILGYSAYFVGVPVAREFNSSFAMKEFRQYGIAGTYHRHFFTFLDRFKGLENLETENETLRSQLARLEKDNTLAEASKAERDLASMNAILEKKVGEEAGAKTARLPQSIAYEVPSHLLNPELYTLALAYFRKQEFEKTVVLLAYLDTLPEETRFHTAENSLMAGIAWYQLKNYHLAQKEIGDAIAHSDLASTVHRQAMLWDALVEKASGKTQIAQTKLLNFIGKFPHSTETAWINGDRHPARTEVGHEVSEHAMKPLAGEANAGPSSDVSEPKESAGGEAAHGEKKETEHEAE